MKSLQGALVAMLATLVVTGVATAQQYSAGNVEARRVSHSPAYIVSEPAPYGCHGGNCGGGCCPPNDCCNPCQKHGLAVLWERMKKKMCERNNCKKSCCQSACCEPVCKVEQTCRAEPTCKVEPSCCAEPACCAEPTCVADSHCCSQKTCCPHPISCAPELGPCCSEKKFSLCNLFQRKKKNQNCNRSCCEAGQCDGGCCQMGFPPSSYRGGYPVYHGHETAPMEQHRAAPQPREELMPPPPPRPTVEQTSNERAYPSRGVARPPVPAASYGTRRGPI